MQEDEAPTEATAYVPLVAEDSGNLSADPKMTERSVMSDFSDSIMGTNRSFSELQSGRNSPVPIIIVPTKVKHCAARTIQALARDKARLVLTRVIRAETIKENARKAQEEKRLKEQEIEENDVEYNELIDENERISLQNVAQEHEMVRMRQELMMLKKTMEEQMLQSKEHHGERKREK